MPLYEYQCEACGKRFEVIQKFSDPPVEVCTQCGKGPVARLLSSPAIQFKGSGWYITDYAKGRSSAASSTNAGKDGSTSEKDSSSSDTAKSDSGTTKAAGEGTKTSSTSSNE